MTVNKTHTDTLDFLADGGEMGELTRNHDWRQSELGTPDTWPASLRTTLSIILNSRYPLFLFWGPDSLCFYNDAYRPSLGHDGKHPTILGLPARDAWPETWDILEPQISQVLNGGEATWFENARFCMYRDGKLTETFWTYSYSGVKDEYGHVVGVFVTCTETTAQLAQARELEQMKVVLESYNSELREMNEHLKHSNEDLSQYAFAASHDLQEPLRKIRSFSDRLAKTSELSPQGNEWLKKIRDTAKRMSTLIQALLELSRVQRMAPELIQLTNLNDVVKSVANDFELLMQEKDATLQVKNKLPVVDAVGLQMGQLFYNLVGNALKFTKPGVPPVITIDSCAITRDEAQRHIGKLTGDGQYHHITVSDNGIGFEQKHAQKIFEVFNRLHKQEAYPGSGLGLALCLRVVANHGGALYAEGESGKGATFHIILPDKQQNAAPQ